jgi:phage terminase large subunit
MSKATFCSIFNPLLKLGKYRYKISYGGRAGMKTEHYALALLKIASKCKCRILCTREIQNSIEDSVYQTLCDIIKKYNLNYTIKKTTIVHNKTGSEFLFKGLLKQTVNSLKSIANIDIVWVEEAHSVSQKSWDVLIPTIHKKHSEIWITFNPEREDDPVYEMFINQKVDNAWLLNINYDKNPWFEDSPLQEEMERCKRNNYSKYRHIWLGEPISDYETLVYRFDRQVNIVEHEIKYNEGFETVTSWDFGTSDDTAIIFYQIIPCMNNDLGYEIHVFDEYVNNNEDDKHYRDVVDSKGYLIDRHYCDPAGSSRQSDLSSWIDKLKKNKYGQIDWHFEYSNYYRGKVAQSIDIANDIVPYIRYNQHQVPHFHKMAFHWQFRTDKDDKIVLPPKPNHDEFSHMGTSLYYMAVNRFPPKGKAHVRVIK